MAKTTILVGLVLIVMGAGSYFGSGMVSMTALIPAFFGIPIALLGAAARDESRRKHAMHGAILLALLGFLGSVPGLLKLETLLAGTAERPMATAMQSVMAILLAVFIVLCVRSFIAARKAREAA
jgi:hypothetical protein